MRPPPLFRHRPPAVRFIGAIVLPVAFGALCGFMLGTSGGWYNLLMLLAGIGGVAAGYEHAGAREGAIRGLVGAVLFVGALVAVFEARGVPALATLPALLPVMAVFYVVTGIPLGALGGWLRGRSEGRRAQVSAGS
jgi:hypothetical protein